MLKFVWFLALVAVIQGAELSFEDWKSLHGKTYSSAEHDRRQAIFETNRDHVSSVNEDSLSFTVGLNEYADLTLEEFLDSHTGFRPNDIAATGVHKAPGFLHASRHPLPKSVDWRDSAVTSVKNQATCGSCWAFSAVGAVEGANALFDGSKPVSLSVQELVDCDGSDAGCGGGLMDNAFDFIIGNGGIDTWKDYGYFAFGLLCQAAKEHDRPVVSIDSYQDVPPNSEAALAAAVAAQPVAVAVCVDSSFQLYTGGVYHGSTCTGLNHGVLAVGYGETGSGKPYWLVKNSWGETWGEQGYIRLAKDVEAPEGQNGIAMSASFPIKKTPNPTDLPEVCDYFGWQECAHGSHCRCDVNVFDLFCLWYSCADGAAGGTPSDVVDCGQHRQCPHAFPQCDIANERCFDDKGDRFVPMVDGGGVPPVLTMLHADGSHRGVEAY